MNWEVECQKISRGIRERVLEHTINHGGYLSQACSSAEQLAWLYNEALNIGDSIMPSIPDNFSGVPHIDNKTYKTGSQL